MGATTKIQWCDKTFNHVRGCTKVSAGCANCYAETLSGRNPGTLGVWGPNGTRVVASEAMWLEPVKWNEQANHCTTPACSAGVKLGSVCPICKALNLRPRVFCASLADVFEDWQGPMRDAKGQPLFTSEREAGWHVPPFKPGVNYVHVSMSDVRRRLLDLIDATPNLDWLLLTKRPENVLRFVSHNWAEKIYGGFPKNVWLGTSVENQAAADARIPHLLKVPAAVRFLSCEPLLEQVYLRKAVSAFASGPIPEWGGREAQMTGLHWVIVGGESGSGARPCDAEWIASIVRQCKAASVPVFVKQVGSFVVDRNDVGFDATAETWAEGPDEGKPTDPRAWPDMPDIEEDLDGTRDGYQGAPVRVRLRDKKGGSPEEWPESLRVRQFPEVRTLTEERNDE